MNYLVSRTPISSLIISRVYTSQMDSKRTIWILMMVGGFVGGYIPSLWGAPGFSFASIFGNAMGAILGIWIGFKLTR
jgi:uncharacterized membrane protein YeaQ/YmgE (transglycosylase-associated protein family)